MSRYPHMKDREVVELTIGVNTLRFACCDCGMVHDFDFKSKGKRLLIRICQRKKCTGQQRRHKYGNLHKGVRGWKLEHDND